MQKEILEIIQALTDEITAVRKKYQQKHIFIRHLKLSNVSGELFYEGIVSNLEEGDLISIPEGVPVRGIFKDYNHISRQYEEFIRDGKLLYYDSNTHQIVFSFSGAAIDFSVNKGVYRIQPVVEELLIALQNQLREKELYLTSYATQIISNKYLPSINIYPVESIRGNQLNESQFKALQKVYSNNITFIWGPPGTGKTTTLATLIKELIFLNKKVLAVSVSNVAVDQIALKCIKTASAELLKSGELVRFGYAKLSEVRDQDILFPQRDTISQLRKEIRNLEKKLSETNTPVLKAKFQNDIADRQKAIRKATIEPLFHAKTVLTTSIQCCLVEELKDINFDVVIIDEASMMSVAMVAFLSTLAREKLIISGDYRQLHPIALANTQLALKWLHKDVFEISGISKFVQHELLAMLEIQHRMDEPICEIINKEFYNNRLKTNIKDSNRIGALFPPECGKQIVFKGVSIESGNTISITESFSRYNVNSSVKVIECLKRIARYPRRLIDGENIHVLLYLHIQLRLKELRG